MGIVLNFVKESPTLIILSLLFYVAIYYYRYFIRENPLPGPFPIPALGNILYVIVYKGDYGKLGLDLQKKYGDIFEFYFGSERQIWLGRADLAAKIFKTNHFKRMNFSHGLNEINGHDNGLLNNTNYVTWRRNRKILQSAISTPIFMKSVVIPDAQALFTDLESLWARLGPETEIDLAGWLYRFTCQFIIKACTSQKKDVLREYYYNYLTPDPSISTGEHEDWTELVKHVGTTTEWLFAFPKWLRIYLPGFRQHHESVVKKFYHVCERIENEFVKPARMEMEDMPINKDAPRDLLSLLCSSETKNPNMSPMTDHEIARVLVEVFLNGSEAVASLVSFMTYFLCLHPKHYKALQHEISEVIGSDLDKPITYEQLNKLVYCEAIFKETARLIPFLPTINRVSSADDEISGMQWPADTMFLVNTCGIHSHPSHWAEPEKFDPSRFLDKDGELDGKSDMYTFLPFGGGARFCPGRFLGMTELKVIMVLLFGKYDVRLVDENSSPNRIYEGGANVCEEMKVFIKPKIRYRRKNQTHAVS